MKSQEMSFSKKPHDVSGNTSKIFNTFSDIMENYDPEKNILPTITKYEFTKIKGIRLEQLARNAPSTVDTEGLKSIEEVCMKEFKEKKMPLIIMRPFPNGKKEYWRVNDLIIPQVFYET